MPPPPEDAPECATSNQGAAPPDVSVIMATFNGASFIRQSIDSILRQSVTGFELIVVDGGSTDGTHAILAGIQDQRLRVLTQRGGDGMAAARNLAFDAARGRYVAMADDDGLSRPARLAAQMDYLDAHPDTVLLGAAAHTLTDGVLAPAGGPATTTNLMIEWLLHIANPLPSGSVMFRAGAARLLAEFMRQDAGQAGDFDFYHRMARQGEVARLDQKLTIGRVHGGGAGRPPDSMTNDAARVLAPAYGAWFGEAAQRNAELAVRHFAAGAPVEDGATLARLAEILERVTNAFLHRAGPERQAMLDHAHTLWRGVLRATAARGGAGFGAMLAVRPLGFTPSSGDYVHLAPVPLVAGAAHRFRPWRKPPRPAAGRLFDTVYEPVPSDTAAAPSLLVVVDTEAEFDWSAPFATSLTQVSAMDAVERGQAVFDRYGARPVYVVDYPVASQPRGYEKLRAIMRRDGCAIGAHLHPWTTPPFSEEISSRNSYPGNLPPALEEEKLARLIAVITENFGAAPQFYKAGRYGFGPETATALARHGIKIDLSVLPGADLRWKGGPDFSQLGATPYRIAGTGLLSLPMTRADIGAASSAAVSRLARHRLAERLHVPALLSRLRVNETVTLTPEGVTAAEQIRLIKALLHRGQRLFVLHYHSPSLSPGHTPYVRDEADARAFIANLQEVCRYFFEELGGMPAYPADLAAKAETLSL